MSDGEGYHALTARFPGGTAKEEFQAANRHEAQLTSTLPTESYRIPKIPLCSSCFPQQSAIDLVPFERTRMSSCSARCQLRSLNALWKLNAQELH